jgi:hypothetical protein
VESPADFHQARRVGDRCLGRTRKLFAFLRAQRHELFDDAFQTELETMSRDTGAGKPPVPPALLTMVTLLQAYLGVSDAEAVELSVMDRRRQLVLDSLETIKPLFSQGVLGEFRVRLICTERDRWRLGSNRRSTSSVPPARESGQHSRLSTRRVPRDTSFSPEFFLIAINLSLSVVFFSSIRT